MLEEFNNAIAHNYRRCSSNHLWNELASNEASLEDVCFILHQCQPFECSILSCFKTLSKLCDTDTTFVSNRYCGRLVRAAAHAAEMQYEHYRNLVAALATAAHAPSLIINGVPTSLFSTYLENDLSREPPLNLIYSILPIVTCVAQVVSRVEPSWNELCTRWAIDPRPGTTWINEKASLAHEARGCLPSSFASIFEHLIKSDEQMFEVAHDANRTLSRFENGLWLILQRYLQRNTP